MMPLLLLVSFKRLEDKHLFRRVIRVSAKCCKIFNLLTVFNAQRISIIIQVNLLVWMCGSSSGMSESKHRGSEHISPEVKEALAIILGQLLH